MDPCFVFLDLFSVIFILVYVFVFRLQSMFEVTLVSGMQRSGYTLV